MTEEELKYFYSDFKKIRQSKNISIDDIIHKTKIQKHYIRAIESGNFKILPPAYIRLFLIAYSKALGMDEDEILRSHEKHISGKSKKFFASKTPQFIENKDGLNKKEENNKPRSSNLLNSTYFIDPKKTTLAIGFLVFIMVAWITLAKISESSYEEHEILFSNTKLNWDFFKPLELLDSQFVKINSVNKKNVFRYESSNSKNKILITNDSGINIANRILNENDEDENTIGGNVEFGILNGKLNFYINGQQIDFKYPDKTLIGSFKPKNKKNNLLIKYFK